MATFNDVIKYKCESNRNIESNVFDNWEDITEKDDIPVKLSNVKGFTEADKIVFEVSEEFAHSSSTANVTMSSQPVIIQAEDNYRTQYVPPEPQVKILKRNEKVMNDINAKSSILNGFIQKPKASTKSLEQREAEYMEARLRIMGEAKYPEEKEKCMDLQKKFELLKPTSNLLRQPKGPDGTSGFKQSR